jgi:hypothetical protein
MMMMMKMVVPGPSMAAEMAEMLETGGWGQTKHDAASVFILCAALVPVLPAIHLHGNMRMAWRVFHQRRAAEQL